MRTATLAIGVMLASVSIAPVASAQQGCIYFYPARVVTASSSECGNGPLYGHFISILKSCEGPGDTQAGCGDEFSNWYPTNLHTGCSPSSGSYAICDPGPTPKDCSDPANAPSSCVGDPVDVTTGTLERTATDIDLGRGLAFTRFYASHASVFAGSPLGPQWKHSLDWRLWHEVIATGSSLAPTVDAVTVRRPLRTAAAFTRQTLTGHAPEPWVGGVRGAGGLTGSPSSGFVFTDDDGTRVTFAATTFAVTQIQRPGEAAIAVTAGSNANETVYTVGDASLTVTLDAGKVATVASTSETWSYGYDGNGCLYTVTGPNPGSPSVSVQWRYNYAASGTCQLTSVERKIGSGAFVEIASWSYAGSLVSSADEPALDQKLYLTYSGTAGNRTTTVRDTSDTQAPALATYTSTNGRVASTTEDGGPGVDLSLRAAEFTGAAPVGAPANRWKTVTDLNYHVTLYENHDARGRPRRVVEAWEDAETSGAGHGEFSPADTFLRKREFEYHPALDDAVTVAQRSVLNSADDRVETHDYDSDLDATANEAPTDRLYRRMLDGWTLDEDGAQVAFTDVTEYAYDTAARLTQIKGPYTQASPAPDPYVGPLTVIEYDATSGSRSAIKRYPAGAGSTPLTWTFASFDAQGNPQTVTDPNGRATAFTYDALGRVLTAKPPCEAEPCTGTSNTTVTFQYDVDGNLAQVTFPPDSASQPVSLTFDYDPAKPSRLLSIVDSQKNAIVYGYTKGRVTSELRYQNYGVTGDPPAGQALVGQATFDHDDAGRLLHAFNPLFPNQEHAGTVSSTFAHDAKGNPTGVTDENGRHDDLGYDALDRLKILSQVRSATYDTEFAYDALSNVTRVTDAASKATDLLHDDRGNLVETVSPDTGRTRFLYDAAGNLTTKIENAPSSGTDGARITRYEYDGLSRLTKIDFPTYSDWIFTYDTDAAKNQKGRLAQVTNGSVTTKLEYTRRGDVAAERTTIDGLRYDVLYTYDAAGNRASLQAPSATRSDTSYAGLRPSQLAITGGTRTELLSAITWYPFGPRTSATFPPDDVNGNTVTSSRTVNLRGQIEEVAVSRPGATLVDRSYVYDYTAGTPGPNDPGPNLDEVIDHLHASDSRFFFYDELDRLQKATDLSGTALFQYAYDAVGNRTSQIDGTAETDYAYERLDGLQINNRLDAATGVEARDYHHDAFGNRDYDGADAYVATPSLAYDEANRLVTVLDPQNAFATLATYTYDAFGRRVKKVVGSATVLFFYDTEGHLIEEIQKVDGAADVVRTYVYLEDELVQLVDKTKEVGTAAWVVPGGRTWEIEPPLLILALALLAGIGAGAAARRWPVGIATTASGGVLLLLCAGTQQSPRFAAVHVDPLGTPLAVTNVPATWTQTNQAKVIWRATYEPFGKADVDEDPDGDTATFSLAVRFPGQYEDAETGWHYNMFRYYDPTVGRYTSPDPVGQPPIRFVISAPIWTSGVNPYAYALTNPFRLTDPLGLYGTGSCDYYTGRCDESAGDYYCRIAPSFCRSFPDFGSQDPDPTRDDDFEGWARCTRQCLQDCDAEQNADQNMCPREPDPTTDEFLDPGASECHVDCYLSCWAWGAFAPDPRR